MRPVTFGQGWRYTAELGTDTAAMGTNKKSIGLSSDAPGFVPSPRYFAKLQELVADRCRCLASGNRGEAVRGRGLETDHVVLHGAEFLHASVIDAGRIRVYVVLIVRSTAGRAANRIKEVPALRGSARRGLRQNIVDDASVRGGRTAGAGNRRRTQATQRGRISDRWIRSLIRQFSS